MKCEVDRQFLVDCQIKIGEELCKVSWVDADAIEREISQGCDSTRIGMPFSYSRRNHCRTCQILILKDPGGTVGSSLTSDYSSLMC